MKRPGRFDCPETVAAFSVPRSGARLDLNQQTRSRVFALAYGPRSPGLRDVLGRPGDVVVLDGVRIVGNMAAGIALCEHRTA